MENEMKGRLTREFREQINDLLAAAQLLTPLVREEGSRRDVECLAVIHRSLYQMIRTVFHMELCEEELSFQPAVIDLAGLCRDVGRQVESIAKELEISFQWELEKETLLSMGDERLLEQAVFNMLSNAFEAAGKGGQVTLRLQIQGERCRITVGDSGAGLQQPEKSDDLYLKQPGGVGLGLEAARRVAGLHGGALVLEDREEGGVRAVLSLPIQLPEKRERMETPRMRYDRTGGFSPLLVEFSPLLPTRSFMLEDME